MGPELSNDARALVNAANGLEQLALDLAQRGVEENVAIKALADAAGGNVRAMRRAHRHCEFALSQQWPAGSTLIRAFDYLSAGRRQLELQVYDFIDEVGMESFPASDAPSFWAR